MTAVEIHSSRDTNEERTHSSKTKHDHFNTNEK